MSLNMPPPNYQQPSMQQEGHDRPFFVTSLRPEELLPDHIGFRHPHYIFNIGRAGMIGSGVIEATPETRLRSLNNAVLHAAPTSIETAYNPPPDRRISIVAMAADTKRFINGNAAVKKQLIRRQDILPAGHVLGLVEHRMNATNNPLLQALRQTRTQYGEDMGGLALQQLGVDVLCGTQPALVRQIYDTTIRNIRSRR
jgi:hypothetical protein